MFVLNHLGLGSRPNQMCFAHQVPNCVTVQWDKIPPSGFMEFHGQSVMPGAPPPPSSVLVIISRPSMDYSGEIGRSWGFHPRGRCSLSSRHVTLVSLRPGQNCQRKRLFPGGPLLALHGMGLLHFQYVRWHESSESNLIQIQLP